MLFYSINTCFFKKGPFQCSFTYVAQGGTNEEWEMTIGVNADKSAYSCNIARPSGTTYLFFESYEIKVEGGSIEHYGTS